MASNVGLAIGPLVGALLLRISFSTVRLVAASFYIVGAVSTLMLIPPRTERRVNLSSPPGLLKTVGTVVRDRTFVIFSVIMCGYYLLGTQLYITVPLETARLTGSTGSIGVIYLVNSIVAITLQFPLVRYAARYLGSLQSIIVGIATLAASLGVLALEGGFLLILASVAVAAAARVLIEPVMNASVADIASKAGDGVLACYFGFSALSIAIGGATGQLLGGWLFDQARDRDMAALPWGVLGTIGVGVTVALWVFSRTLGAARFNDDAAAA